MANGYRSNFQVYNFDFIHAKKKKGHTLLLSNLITDKVDNISEDFDTSTTVLTVLTVD